MKRKISTVVGIASLLGLMAITFAGACYDQNAESSADTAFHYLVVRTDSYGVPIRCAAYDHPISLKFDYAGGTVKYMTGTGVAIFYVGPTLTIAKIDAKNPTADADAYDELGITPEDCAVVQRRRFNPESDTYMTPDEKAEERSFSTGGLNTTPNNNPSDAGTQE